MEPEKSTFPRWMKATLTVAWLSLLVGGAWFYRVQEQAMRRRAERELTSIAHLKVNQVVAWREERLGDAVLLSKRSFLLERLSVWLENPDDPGREKFLADFSALQQHEGYANIILVDPDGQMRLALKPPSEFGGSECKSYLDIALRERKAVFTDIHAEANNRTPHISVIAPLFVDPEHTQRLLGAVILIIDISKFLYPLIQSWPTPSETAETLLVRRDGGHVLFLNELRHQPGTALKLRIPLTQTDVPSVMAVLGHEGIVHGTDYRGTKVVSAILPIPNSPWFMVAKEDESEVFAEWRTRSVLMLALLVGMTTLMVAAGFVLWQREKKGHYRALYQSEAALHASTRQYQHTLDNMMEGCQIIGPDWRYLYINETAAQHGRKTRDELIGRTVMEVYPDYATTSLFAVLQHSMTERVPQRTDSEILYPDGTRGYFDLSVQPVPEGIFVLSVDITERKQAEEEIKSAKAFLDRVIDMSPFAMWISDKEGTVIRTNRSLCEVIRLTEKQIVGHYNVLKDANLEMQGVMPQVRAVFEKCIPTRFCIPWKAADAGDVEFSGARDMHIDVSMFPILDAKGELTNVVCQWVDITEQKKVEESLNIALQHLRHFIDSDIIGVLIASPDGTVIEANDYYLNTIGFTRDELECGKVNWREITPAEWLSADETAIRELREKGTSTPYEKEYVRRDGTRVPVFLAETMLPGPEERIASFALDMTERKKAEKALEKSEKMYRDAIETAQAAVYYQNYATDEFEFMSPTIEQLMGYTPDEFTRQVYMSSVRETILLGDLSGLSTEEAIRKARGKEGISWKADVRVETRSGEERWLANCAVQVRDDTGRVVGSLGILQDITERKRLEERFRQAQRMESVGRLAGGVAHDFNNNLQVIVSYADMALRRTDPTERLHEDLRQILMAANRSADLTRQLLAFARKQTVAPKVLNLNETVEGMLKMLRRLIGEDIDLTWKPDSHLWPIRMDPAQIDQILANLCVNARDAIKGVGQIIIETHTVTFDEAYCADHAGFIPGDFVLLAVSDDGCGMDKQILDNIFEPFFTTKGTGEGTGLGLATVYGIVRQNNGFINVYSEPGSGTTFRIYLPRHAGETGETRAESTVEISRGHGETVLLVEDEPAILKMTARMLENQGYVVLAANTPDEAIRLATEHPKKIHLLMTDVVMPQMNGRDLAQRLQVTHPSIQCLFMSGYTADVIAHRGVLDEGVQFIQKPFSSADLAIKVQEALTQNDERTGG
ncbi:MAG TPA: PAS domain S-box protein [bacterium]|nr:PAS domain S-box protein [bacterium]